MSPNARLKTVEETGSSLLPVQSPFHASAEPMVRRSVLACIGNTPLVTLSPGVYAKAEYFNPSGSIKARMAKAGDEMSHWAEYDYVVINEDIDISAEQIRAILAAERLKRERQVGLTGFVRGLQSQL